MGNGLKQRGIATARTQALLLVITVMAACLCLVSCANSYVDQGSSTKAQGDYLTFLDNEPDSADPQCISTNYTVALNVFDRLVEVDTDDDEGSQLVPSLAESWEVSDDELTYTFHLHEGVRFSNGSELTSEDVSYTLKRLLTHEDSCNRDIALDILGAHELVEGTADELEGFHALDDLTFTITLEQPSAPFLASLSAPGASILDEESTEAAGDEFGTNEALTVGTGPFVFDKWEHNKQIIMTANKACWAGAPRCAGLTMRFYSDTDSLRDMFTSGDIDILDLDKLGMDAEYFLRGDIYRTQLIRGPRVGISFIALNESVAPLNDVRIRKALQLAIDRQSVLQAAISGRGTLENGIYPRGLIGYNPNLAPIDCNPTEARRLLEEAGYGNGFTLDIQYPASTKEDVINLLTYVSSMWSDIGVQARLIELPDNEFTSLRMSGDLSCYTSTWSADYNDPDNFVNTYFGSVANTTSRSICYTNTDVMERIQAARAITDDQERIAEYQALEETIVHEDAAWIPLYSQLHFFVVSDRVDGFHVLWNGWSSNRYSSVSVTDGQG